MSAAAAYQESDAITSPAHLRSEKLFGLRDEADLFVASTETQLGYMAHRDALVWWEAHVSFATETAEIAKRNFSTPDDYVVLHGMNFPDLRRPVYPHWFSQGSFANSTAVERQPLNHFMMLKSQLAPSPRETAPASVPDVVVNVPDVFAGYDSYAVCNWDCYDAEPISSDTVDAARELIRRLPPTFGMPHVSPGSDGTIGLEWVFTDRSLRKLFIDVGPGRVWSGYWRRSSGERRTIAPKPIDMRTEAELAELFKELSN